MKACRMQFLLNEFFSSLEVFLKYFLLRQEAPLSYLTIYWQMSLERSSRYVRLIYESQITKQYATHARV